MNFSISKIIFPASLILTGIVHLIPSRILLDPAFIKEIYGIETMDNSIKLIILHRASFFFFLSIFSIATAFLPPFQDLAYIFCMFSMLAFIILFQLFPAGNDSFQKVLKVDVVLVIILTASYSIHKFTGE